MSEVPVAERLPRLYRAVLDAVAELEAHGHRQEAAAIRSEATAAYSRAWNLAAERRLMALRMRASRIIEDRPLALASTTLEPRSLAIDLDRPTA